jgi:sensor histidine kinase YesM
LAGIAGIIVHGESRVNITARSTSLSVLFYVTLFLVTQVTGLLLSLVICYVLQDFTWVFVRMALADSLLLGLTLMGSCYLTQRMLSRMNTLSVVAISGSLVLGMAVISALVVLFAEPTLFIYYYRGALSFLFVNFLFVAGLQVISSGLIIYREVMVGKEKTIGEERLLKQRMEMQLLASRINPHFLFNTLNMILALLKQPAKAEVAILNLSDLLRQNLEHTDRGSVPVREELENVRKYLEIQKLRFEERLDYEIRGDAAFSIPPMIIQPLVENSIKHNMQTVTHLAIEVAVSTDGVRNRIDVRDSVKAVDASMLNKGQGLTITRTRVEKSGGTFSIEGGGIAISFSR